MQLGLIIYGDLEMISGGYLYDRKLVEYLRNQGDEVKIISLTWRNYLLHLSDNFSYDLQRRLENLQVDVLLEDELNHPSLFLVNKRLRQKVNFPIVAIIHHLRSSEQHPYWLMWFYRQVEASYITGLDGVIFNSQTTRLAVEEMFKIKCGSIVAHPAGNHLKPQISEEQIIMRAKREGPLRLLFLGNVIPRKGLNTLIEALRLLPVDAFHLSIVGGLDVDAGHVRSVQRQIGNTGLAGRITFHGSLDHNSLIPILQQSQVLVVPSIYEGFGIVYLEGMGYGMPAIASRSGGAGEIITHGQNGYLVESGNASELASLLYAMHQDRARLCEMSLAARQRFETHPGWEQAGESIRQYLLSLRRDWDVKT
jgi:glycosyltransferase involved in cell wall biosynthesis